MSSYYNNYYNNSYFVFKYTYILFNQVFFYKKHCFKIGFIVPGVRTAILVQVARVNPPQEEVLLDLNLVHGKYFTQYKIRVPFQVKVKNCKKMQDTTHEVSLKIGRMFLQQ